MEKTLNRQQAQAILDTRPDGVDIPTALKELSNQGFTIEGYNDHPVQNAISNVGSVAKSVVGGIGEGVGGIALTGIEKAGEALTGKKVDLHGQWQQQFGKSENPTAYGMGELGGQVASLTAPVGALGNVAKGASEMVGLGKNVSTLTKAATEGLAFTKGMELQSGQKASPSDYYVNTALNVAFPVAGIVGKGLAENIAPRIVNSLIKPLAKDFAYEKNPGKAVAELGITGNSWEDLIKNITSSKDQIGQSIGQVISKSQNLQQMDLSQTLKSIDEAISNAYKTPRTNATLIGRLESVKQDLVDNIQNGIDPQSFKGLVGDLTKWTGNVSDDQAVNKALKQVYGATRSGMDNILSKEMTPEEFSAYKKASEQYGNLLSAENAAKYRDKVVERQDLISFGAKNAGLITALGTAMATGGSAVPSIIAGLGASAIDKAMATPAFKTRLASLLSKMSPSEVGTLFDKVPTAKTLFTPEQIKDFTGELKKNSKLNRGMVNPSELLPKKAAVSSIDERLTPLVDNEGMVTVYRASSQFPETLPKDTFVSTKPDNVRYYAESWYKGDPKDIEVKSFKIPANLLKRGGNVDNWQLTEDFNWNKTSKAVSSLEQEAKKTLTPTKVYHGTPNDFKGEPNFPLYLTSDKKYADIYQNPSASSLSSGKKAGTPTTKEFTVNPNAKVLDSRTPEGKALLKDYWDNYSVSGMQVKTESGLPDWTEGTNLEEFLAEKGYKYDAILLDEGGVPTSSGVKSRGISFVALNKNAFKSKTLTPSLEQEAKKYKSAEEFVKAQGNPLYHGTNADFTVFDKKKIGSQTDEGFFGKGFYFGNTESFAKIAPFNSMGGFPKNIMTVYLPKDIKLFDINSIKTKKEMANLLNMSEDALTQDSNGIIKPILSQSGQFTSHLIDLGYDGAVVKRGKDAIETVVFEPEKIKTKSQLTDIWNRAHGK